MNAILEVIAPFIILSVVVSGIGWLIWWLFIESEGVYLGRRAVIWLYDVYAARYDDIKHFRREYDHMYLAQPIMDMIAPIKSPMILDVATGTARLPIAMLRHGQFMGRVFGIDLSRKMLANAAAKTSGEPRIQLLHAPAEHLPFADGGFDVVTLLESLEFMPSPVKVVEEAARVLRPGGILVTTLRISTRLMPGKTWTEEQAVGVLEEAGFDDVQFEIWQMDYTLIWARKNGESAPTLARPLLEMLQCPHCAKSALGETANMELLCSECNTAVPVGQDGVIEYVDGREAARVKTHID